MKKMKTKYLMVAAAAALLSACNNDENEVNDGPVEARITAGIAGPQTRAIGTQWNADNIGVMVTAATGSNMKDLYKNVKYTTTSTGDKADFSAATGAGIFFQDAKETVTFAAYAPYQQSDADALPGTNGAVTVNTADKNGDQQETIDFLYASGATASRSNSTVTFANIDGGTDCSFKHKMARLDLVLQVSTTDGFSADQIFADANTVNLSGLKHAGTFNVTTGVAAVNANATVTNNWNITACKKADDETTKTRTYSLILLPQDASATGLPLTINIGGQNYMNTGDIKPNLEAGNSYTYTITVKKTGLTVSGCTITDWNSSGTGSGNAEMYIGSKSAAQAAVGDFYMSDGSLEDKNATLTDAQKAACLGIVMKVGKDTDGDWKDDCTYKQKDGTTPMTAIHGYVLALYDADSGNTYKWGPNDTDVGTNDASKYFNGYKNTQTIIKYAEDNSKTLKTDFPATYYATVDYESDYPAPANSSGWFLPSGGQCRYWHNNSSTLLLAQVRKAMGNNNYAWKNCWSSSEVGSNYKANCMNFTDGGVFATDKSATHSVRSCLVF